MTPVVYISGSGRSGTNILKSILSKHSQVATLPFEQRYTVDPDGLFDFYKNLSMWTPYIADKKLKRLESFLLKIASKSISTKHNNYAEWELNKWIPNYQEHVQQLIEAIRAFSYTASYPGSLTSDQSTMYYYSYQSSKIGHAIQQFMDKCHQSIVQNQSKMIFAEDNTWTFLYADILPNLSPSGKLIHIIRNPKDVIASMLQQSWTPNVFEHVVEYYQDILYNWLSIRSTLDDKYFIEIKLEELIETTKKTLNKICNFLHIKIESNMYNIQLDKGKIGRYKNELTNSQVAIIEKKLNAILKEYNYAY